MSRPLWQNPWAQAVFIIATGPICVCCWTVPLEVENPLIGATIFFGGSVAWIVIIALLTLGVLFLVAMCDYLEKRLGIG